MIDRVFVNAVAADGSPLNLAVADGRIVSLGSERPASAGAEVIDLAGHLVLPGLVDGHIHLDKSFVGDRWHCLLYTSPSPRDRTRSRMPSSA